jgi:hypothetical protein
MQPQHRARFQCWLGRVGLGHKARDPGGNRRDRLQPSRSQHHRLNLLDFAVVLEEQVRPPRTLQNSS